VQVLIRRLTASEIERLRAHVDEQTRTRIGEQDSRRMNAERVARQRRPNGSGRERATCACGASMKMGSAQCQACWRTRGVH
jgi:hypothetical protein